METSISVVISAWNEEVKLDRTLASVAWADEIVVIDNSSTDGTARIAKKHKAKVFRRPNNPMLNVNKNYGFEKATGTWILSLDADEVVPQELAAQMRKIVAQEGQVAGYWIPRKNIIFGKWIQYGLWWPDKQLRLFQKGKGKFPCVHVHEYLAVDGPTGELTHPYIHYNYETISQFLRKMDSLYSESEVQKLAAAGYTVSWYDALRFPVSDFVKIYFAQHGYKDGLHGLILSMLQGMYSFVVFAKLWERQKFTQHAVPLESFQKESRRAQREIQYWFLTARINEHSSFIGTVLLKAARKLVAQKLKSA